uniref:Uncharacterized protein n=1 Tax=Lactuca sativa TaxID=4236 RepID=A0A9R1XNI9_LACSA|nr:hypothetical protein LSAT_V11C400162830 [Lactuca sativa]
MFHVVACTMEMEMWYSLLTIGIPYCHWFTSKHIIMNMCSIKCRRETKRLSYQFQGHRLVDDFSYTNLPPNYFNLFKMYDLISVNTSTSLQHQIITVTHEYTWELKTTEGGHGIHSIINDQKLYALLFEKSTEI